MEESTSREKVLKNIRNALVNISANPFANIDFDSPIYKEITDLIELNFAQELIQCGGKFVYCENQNVLTDNLLALSEANDWQDIFCLEPEFQEMLTQAGIAFLSGENSFKETKIGITGCEYLVSRLGSIVVSSKQISGRRLNFFPNTHIVIARVSQVVTDLKDAFAAITSKYGSQLPSLITLITGPSRTADIEKTLVMGAHGPKELIVFLLEN